MRSVSYPAALPEKKIIDLSEYRRRLQPEGSLAPETVAEPFLLDAEDERSEAEEELFSGVTAEQTEVVLVPAARRQAHWAREAWALDIAASVGVILMTLAFAAQVLLL